MAETEFIVPDRDTLANALVAFNGSGHMVQKLYPHLINLAGTKQNPIGLVIFLTTTVSDYVDATTHDSPAPQRIAMVIVTQASLHVFARILVGDNEAALNEVFDFMEATGIPTEREEDHG